MLSHQGSTLATENHLDCVNLAAVVLSPVHLAVRATADLVEDLILLFAHHPAELALAFLSAAQQATKYDERKKSGGGTHLVSCRGAADGTRSRISRIFFWHSDREQRRQGLEYTGEPGGTRQAYEVRRAPSSIRSN